MEQSAELERELRPSSFFKVMIGDFSKKMLIPKAFTRRSGLCETISENCFLTTHKGSWRVRVHIKSEMEAYFTDGWSVFVAQHKLIFGEILVFEQLSSSSFFVYAYGHSGCGKDFDGCTKIPIKEELSDDTLYEDITEKDIKRKKRSETGKSLSSLCPNFTVILNALNCRPKRPYMHIPITFVRLAGLDAIDSILVEDTCQNVWTFKLDKATRYSNGSRRVRQTKDWGQFVEANKLRFGEKCIFELDRSYRKKDTRLLKFRMLCYES